MLAVLLFAVAIDLVRIQTPAILKLNSANADLGLVGRNAIVVNLDSGVFQKLIQDIVDVYVCYSILIISYSNNT